MEFLNYTTLPSGLRTLDLSHPLVTGRIALQGAQVLHWQPTGTAPVLWQTRVPHAQPGRSVRGGIPICWPWFGAGGPGQGAHGFARGLDWSLQHTSADAEGVSVQMELCSDSRTLALWNHPFRLQLQIRFGRVLELALTTFNTGEAPLQLTQALHSYLACGDIAQVEVRGLEETTYTDKTRGGRLQTQSGGLRFVGETDRVYEPTAATCCIDDHAGQRRIVLAKSGSQSTVVWNPWLEKAQALGDMEATEYRQMLCVETANAGSDVVHLAPGAQHTLGLRISVEPMLAAPPGVA